MNKFKIEYKQFFKPFYTKKYVPIKFRYYFLAFFI